MSNLNFYLSYDWIYWTRPSGPPSALPAGIERTFVQTPHGALELLYAKPPPPPPASHRRPTNPVVVVFAHGSMGCAWVWTPYMLYLAQHGVASYAVSARGHGESWHPTFLRMVYATTMRDLGDDLVAGIKAVQAREGGAEVVLVGHSSGGGLSQFILHEGDVKVKGLGLLGTIPGTGTHKMYYNWACFDPWFTVRMIFHGWHSNSPLSHPFLTRRAFFSEQFPEEDLLEFQRHMSRYESYWLPMGMTGPFVNARKLLGNVLDWDARSSDKILIMAGTGDKIMTQDIQTQAAETYRSAVSDMVKEKKLDADDTLISKLEGEGDNDDSGQGVRLAWVPGAGHHVQNDVQWKVGAAKLLAWLEQL